MGTAVALDGGSQDTQVSQLSHDGWVKHCTKCSGKVLRTKYKTLHYMYVENTGKNT